MVMDLVEIEPVQLSFDYSEYSSELAASLERHAANMEGFTKRYAVGMGKELAEAKTEIHAEKQTGWAKWVEGRLGISKRHADFCIKRYEEQKLGENIPISPPQQSEPKSIPEPPRLDLPVKMQEEVEDKEEYEYPLQLTEEDRYMAQVDMGVTEYARDGHALVKAQDKRNGVPAALQSSDSNEWYTPAEYIEAARELMGAIDIDPASCEEANHIVKATKFYAKQDNGLMQSWAGRVWLNPPYGMDCGISNQEIWAHQLIERYKAGLTSEAVLLVNANTEAKWFQPLYDYLICLTNHRIRFYNTYGDSSQPTQGNALVYFGSQKRRFIELFRCFGRVIREANANEY